MAIPYPPTLPQNPQRAGFNQQQKSNTIRSEVDIGEAKMRRRYTLPIKNEAWSMLLTPLQVPIFEDFFNIDLQSGVFRFIFTDQITGLEANYRITDMPKLTPYGNCGNYRVVFNTEKLV